MTASNPVSLPQTWNTCQIGDLGATEFAKVNPLSSPDEQFEYYSIPAYQNGNTAELTRGRDVLSQKTVIPSRCVLFGKLNPRVEKVWNIKSSGPFPCIASTEWLPIVPNEGIDQDWLYFLMYSQWVMPVAKTLVTGSTPSRQRVDPKSFYEITVPVPEMREQQAIARILTLVDSTIRHQTEKIELLGTLKRAAMQTLFTRGLRGEAQKETAIGPMPESWEVVRIGDMFTIEQGLSLKGNLATDGGGTPFLRTSNVYWGEIDLQTVSHMQINGAPPPNKLLRQGDLLVCEGGEIGRAAVWNGEIDTYLYQNHLHRLRPTDGIQMNPKYAMAWLEEGFKHRNAYEGAGNRTTIPNLSRARLAELTMPCPQLDEQREIVAILDAIDRKIDLHRRKRAVLEELFKTLLHKLMTGEIRAGELELSAEGVCGT